MDWLLDSLRLVREINDWANARRRQDPSARRTKEALAHATRELELIVESYGLSLPEVETVPTHSRLIDPPGPEQDSSNERDSTHSNGHIDPGQTQLAPSTDGEHVPIITPEEVGNASPRIRIEDIDHQAVLAIKRLRRYGYKGYLVGGCVRDLLLGITPKDFDIVTDARPEEVKSVFRNSRVIGRRFRLVHLYYRGGKVLEVATFRASIPNDDEDDGSGDLLIRRDNVFGSEQEDAKRRDFTINALFYDPENGRIIDHVGGLHDVDARIVRMIGDPNIRLREDPVRIIRAIRFRAKANLTLENELNHCLSKYVEELLRCPPARLLEETLKLLRMGHAEASFNEMLTHGVLGALLPEIQAFIDGRFGLLAGTSIMEHRDPIADIRAHLRGLDQVIARSPVSDDVVLGALMYPLADAIMSLADTKGRDRNRCLTELLSEIGIRIQITRKLSEQLRQSFSAQRYFHSEGPNGHRRRRRISPSSLMRKVFFPAALRLFEIHQRAIEAPLDDVDMWEARARDEGISLNGQLFSNTEPRLNGTSTRPRRRRRRGHRRPNGTPGPEH